MTEEINKEEQVVKQPSLQRQARDYIRDLFSKRPNTYVYHNIKHTEEVVASVRSLAKEYSLNKQQRQLIEVAAWFHDAAYGDGKAEGHEIRGAEMARHFLQERDVEESEIQLVEKCILATQMDTAPFSLPEMILKDADYSHLAQKDFERCADLLRMEWELVDNTVYTETEWLRKNIGFLEEQKFYTTIARNEWDKTKQKHLGRLKKRLATLEFKSEESGPEGEELFVKQSKRYSRGVETMFRVTLRNHINLSRIADNKANFLLSISAIILSLLLGNLITDNKPVASMLLPSIYFLLVCIVTMVFAILATRPNITKGVFSRDALLGKKANILFFGNFHSMPQDEFNWGMDQLIQNEDLLYHSLTTDLYFLGKVLHKKYQYLRTAFHVFMFGLISSAMFYLTMLVVY